MNQRTNEADPSSDSTHRMILLSNASAEKTHPDQRKVSKDNKYEIPYLYHRGSSDGLRLRIRRPILTCGRNECKRPKTARGYIVGFSTDERRHEGCTARAMQRPG
ncbi:hypothetical protein ACFL50_02615 [Candidatus Latescibacterota bacterium]